jgi:hypothetical protein
MVNIRRVNIGMFILMFLIFAFLSKLLSTFDIGVVGIDYYLWIVFAMLLVILNVGFKPSKMIVKNNYLILLITLLLFCLLNFFFVDVPWIRYAQGAFFSFLFAANFVLFYNLRLTRDDFIFLVKSIISIITCIALFTYVERIFLPGEYKSYFLRGVSTFVKDSSFVSALLNINIILCLAMFLISKGRRYIYIVVFSIITIALLLFIKALFVAIIISFVFVRVYYNSLVTKIFLYITAVSFFLAMIFLGKPLYNEIEYKVNMYFGKGYEKIPRNALYLASFRIASDYFPFGSGQGTFGSLPVGKEYSQIYYDYNLDKVQGLSRDDALRRTDSQFIFDTHWSSIIGEMGFVATMLYLWLWFYPSIRAMRYMKRGTTHSQAIAFTVCMMTISVFIESIAAPLPGQLLFIMLYAGLGAIGYRLLIEEQSMEIIKPGQ